MSLEVRITIEDKPTPRPTLARLLKKALAEDAANELGEHDADTKIQGALAKPVDGSNDVDKAKDPGAQDQINYRTK